MFRKEIERTCATCGNQFVAKLRRPWLGWPPWGWKILSGGKFWWTLDELKGTPEYWECDECYERVAERMA